MAMGNPVVDFFSLDVEGAELFILKTIPWSKVHIKVNSILQRTVRSQRISKNKITVFHIFWNDLFMIGDCN